jgi:hypothetical protein
LGQGRPLRITDASGRYVRPRDWQNAALGQAEGEKSVVVGVGRQGSVLLALVCRSRASMWCFGSASLLLLLFSSNIFSFYKTPN